MSYSLNATDQKESLAGGSARITVLALVEDESTRALLPRVLAAERLLVASDFGEGLSLVQHVSPEVVFVEITLGNGAGLAMVHYIKAVAPDTSVFALATKADLEAGAHAVALGGAGLLILPLAGDEILSAVAQVRIRKGEKVVRAELELQVQMNARAIGWIARMAELADLPSRGSAATRLAEVLMEAAGATGAAVYLASWEHAGELTLAAATPRLARTPQSGPETEVLEHARKEGLLDLPLGLRGRAMGHVLLLNPDDVGSSASVRPGVAAPVPALSARKGTLQDGLLKLLATQASAAMALMTERERLRTLAALNDPTTSAYSLAFYADFAAREIQRASRNGRRLTIVAALVEPEEPATKEPLPHGVSMSRAVDCLLDAAPAFAVLGRVDADELHLIMPEVEILGAHAFRRRALALTTVAGPGTNLDRATPHKILIGSATFPHDGGDLTQLSRIARRRAEATRPSFVRRLKFHEGGLKALNTELTNAAAAGAASVDPLAPQLLELPFVESAALAASVVMAALRGGSVVVAVTYRPPPNLFAAVRAVMGSGGPGITLRVLDVRSYPGCEDIEALCVLAEHGAYALIGNNRQGTFHGAHAADPLLADLLAFQLERASGVSIFS